jgi:hypothetical protein
VQRDEGAVAWLEGQHDDDDGDDWDEHATMLACLRTGPCPPHRNATHLPTENRAEASCELVDLGRALLYPGRSLVRRESGDPSYPLPPPFRPHLRLLSKPRLYKTRTSLSARVSL